MNPSSFSVESGQALTSLLKFENRFASLPASFYTRLQPTPLPAPYSVGVSPAAAALIGLDATTLATPAMVEAFTGNELLPGSDPLAAVYSGHQFGVWAGQLGDGRAILLGGVLHHVPHQNQIWELQLKGAGRTPYSRGADGRAVLRSSIREFLCSEAMHGLGIPTTRALCVTGSDQPVIREDIETASVVTRMAPSFVRFGSFEHWFYNSQPEELRTLADYVIREFYPELLTETNPYQALLHEVTLRTARLMAQWQTVGFCHGVMNTDNMSILGLTLDYGPFGFMEAFNANHICNHTDQQGRYAYAMQPRIALWNLYALGQTLVALIGSVEGTQAALESFQPEFDAVLAARWHAKLGLRESLPNDQALIDRLFEIMQANRPDFTLLFRKLGELKIGDPSSDESIRDLFLDRPAFDAWASDYRARLQQEQSMDAARGAAMHAVNPKYVLRNYLAEVAIRKAKQKDFSEVEKLRAILSKPFDEQPENESYAALPPDWASGLEVSCSS